MSGSYSEAENHIFARAGDSPEAHLHHCLLGVRELHPVQGQEWSMPDLSQIFPPPILSMFDLAVVVAPGALTVGQDLLLLPLLSQSDKQDI